MKEQVLIKSVNFYTTQFFNRVYQYDMELQYIKNSLKIKSLEFPPKVIIFIIEFSQ